MKASGRKNLSSLSGGRLCVCVCVYVGNHPTPLSYTNTHAHTPTTHIQIFALIELFVGGWEGWVESV